MPLQPIPWIHTEVDEFSSLQAAQNESGGNHQHKRHTHLSSSQAGSQSRSPRRRNGIILDVDLRIRGFPGRQQPESDAGENGYRQCEQKKTEVTEVWQKIDRAKLLI
jgi:hypothetical protein